MRKRCWKTVLSAILASAMLLTSVPSNLTMTVHAEELGMEDMLVDVNETEDEDEQENENPADDQTGEQAENEADEGQDVQNPVGGGINIVDPADDGDGNDVTDDSDEAADSEPAAHSNDNVELHADEAEVGAVQDGLKVTFSCKPVDGFFGKYDNGDVPVPLSEINDVIVHGEKTPGGEWDDLVTLTKGANGVYTGTWTAPSYGMYKYTFKANNGYYMLYNNKANLRITLIDPDGEYAGPTIDYNPNSSDPGAVTFYFPQTFKGNEVESVIVKGGWDNNWADKITLDEKRDGLWSKTLKLKTLPRDKSVEYGFEVNGPSGWSVDEANPNDVGDNSKLHRNPEIDNSNNDVTLYYYPSHGKYPKTVKVNYRKGDTGDYTEVEMTRDSAEKAVYSVKLTGLEEAEYEYYFDVDGTRVEDTNNAETGKIILVNYPEKDESVTSPEIKDGKVTFNYYGPGQKSVQLAGSMTNWGADPVDMEYDKDTAYWSITLDLGAGFHQYKFISSKEGWIADPLHSEPEQLFGGDKNSYFVIAGLENAEASVGVGDSTELPATLPLWKGDETTDKPATDAIKAVTYALSAETNTAAYKDKITLDKVNKDGVVTPTVSVAEDFPPDVNDFTLTASDGDNNTSTVTVTVIHGVSPEITGKTVKFIYKNDDASKVYVAGTMNGWENAVNSDDYKMEKNETTGKWELTKVMPAGPYEYKYIYFKGDSEDKNWTADPLNPNKAEGNDPNSKFAVAGLVDSNLEVERGGKKAALKQTLDLYDEKGDAKPVQVTYALSAETNDTEYKTAIELTTGDDGKQSVNLTGDFPEDVEQFTLTATAGTETSTVYVSVVDKKYAYTIYYYDAEHYNAEKPLESAALWIYSDGVEGTLYDFDETETLNGNTWLKKELELSLTDLRIIPRNAVPKTSWTWQDESRKYVNKDGADDVTLYMIYDDGHNIYTEEPRNVNVAKRYLVAEYERTDAIADWYLYTWNNGYGNTFAQFDPTPENDTHNGLAQVRLRRGLESLSFCIAEITGTDQSEANWKRKDGGDYRVDVPENQTIVKIQIKQDRGVVKTYPYNIGYELDPADQKIHFYYRDDAAFLAGSEGGHETVVLEVGTPGDDGKVSFETKPMTYNTDDQRYCLDYDLEDVTKAAKYYYRYYLDSEIYVTDDFNDETETIEEKKYSVLNYEMIDAEMEAAIQNDTMDYNDNNVLSIKVNAKDSDSEDAEELKVVKKATVDLSALGGSKEAEIDPELLAISIAVKQGTSAGEKTLPITIEDIYGKEHKTEAKVTVVNRNKGSDFDWDEAVVYFAVTDRFFDGNASNNEGNAPGSYDKNTNDGLNSSYHGGDFAGLTQKLDYLQELGVNTIWITPIVENQTVANSVNDSEVTEAWGYTGYWAKDFTKLDSHLGTEAEFSALLNAAHAKGMKVMVDVVLNHTGYGKEITDYYNTNFKNEDGDVIRMLRDDEEAINGHDQKSSLSGLPDFRTEDPEVRELVVEWQSNWISKYPIDYYRVDTVKHVDDTTWSAFKNALTEINPDFKMIGEWAGAGYATDTGMLDTGRMDALLDFDFPKEAADFVTGDLSGVEGFLSARNGAIDNTASLGSWLSNHDQKGFVKRLTEEKKVEEEYAKDLALVAASLQLTAKGQVYIYYGEEIGVSDGEENYPYQSNRRDFAWEKVKDDNKALAHYKKMISIRNMYSEVLAKGTRETISTDNRLDVFKRSYGGTTLTIALNIDNQEKTYTLTGQAPNTALVDYYSGKQFAVDASGNVEITVPAAADGGTVVLGTENFRIDLPADGGMQIKSIPDQTYTGLSIKLPEDVLQVYAGTTRLTAGVDYTVSYKNNKAIGTATVTIKGKGNYKDSVTAQFNIVPKNIAADDVVITYNEYVKDNGKEQKPLSKITYNGKKLTTKEYQVKYYKKNDSTPLTGVKEAGEYQMEITGLKSYTGKAVKSIFVVKGNLMNTMKITLSATGMSGNSINYTGEEIEPTVEVKNGSDPVGTECYTVSYSNNKSVGTANVIITGVSEEGYFGSVTRTFKIKGKELAKVAQVDTKSWQTAVPIDPVTGNAQQPNAVLAPKGQNGSLTKGKEYTVSYSNNTKPGTATMIFTGNGEYGYTGSVKKTFKITAIAWKQDDLGKNLMITVNQDVPFSKKGAKAGVIVTYKNKRLTEGKDYKLTYSNNKALADANANKKPSVAVTGMGSFSGKVNAGTFTIVKADLATAGITVTVRDAIYSDQNGNFKSKPVVKDADGTILTEGANKDYTLKYYAKVNGEWVDKTEADETLDAKTSMKVEVIAVDSDNCNYTGSTYKEYKVVARSISKATIIAKAQTYTGKAITLDASDFSKAKFGKDTLTYDVDYEIVPGSYEKNVNKGNATVTIRGKGNYGDEKKVTFRITSSGMRWWWNLFS